MKERALAVFRQPPDRLNCAQAVLHAYQHISGEVAIQLADMKPFGGGRAPGGLCGALHAACTVAPGKSEVLRASFSERMGSDLCKDLRTAGRDPCAVCVAQAAELLETELGLRQAKRAPAKDL